ncbi:MAG: radical SAM protein [Bacilli bacterium]
MKISSYNIIKKYDDKILIYNSFSKASIFLDKDSDVSAFESIDAFDKLSNEEKKILTDNGFIVDDSRDEFSEIKYIYEQKYFETDFFNIVLVPSLLCNFRCPYCCEKDYSCGRQDVKKYFEVLKEFAKKNFHLHNIIQVSLFGGEPLLYVNDCLDFLEWVQQDSKKYGYQYFTSIVTNGSLLTEELLRKLLHYNLYSLQITIDSDKENHDSMRIFSNGEKTFDLLMEKVNMIVPNSKQYDKFKFVLRINLNNTTVEKVKKTLERVKPENRGNIYLLIRAIYNTHAYNKVNNNSVNELKEYFDLGAEMGFIVLKEKYNYQTCEACGDRKFFYLMPDLSIWKCINDIGYKNGKIGRLTDEGDTELIPENIVNWYKSCMSAFTDLECMKCKLLPDCLGGCPLYKCKNGKKSCRTFDMACLPFIY